MSECATSSAPPRKHRLSNNNARQCNSTNTRQQDQIFDDVLAKEAPETVKQLKEAVPKVAQEKYGVTPEQLVHLFTTNPVMRSAPFQLMMLDAARYHLAKEAAARPAP